MVTIFNLEKLGILLKDFYALTHIRITVFDEELTELISYPEEVAPYCALIRSSPEGLQACKKCDQDACRHASRRKGTYIYHCHAGLTEAAAALFAEDILVGYLLFGHVFSYASHEEGWRMVKEKCSGLPVNEKELQKEIFKAIPMDEALVRSAAHILHAVASYLIMERIASFKEDLLAVRLNAYLRAHFTEKLNAGMVADDLEIGNTHLYEVSRQLYGCGIAARIRAMRIEKARQMLEDPARYPISQIAAECGFTDYNYFITVFTREVGTSPALWRKN